jgi:hypothetical protein
MKEAQKAALDEPSTLEVVKNTVTSITGSTEGFEQHPLISYELVIACMTRHV